MVFVSEVQSSALAPGWHIFFPNNLFYKGRLGREAWPLLQGAPRLVYHSLPVSVENTLGSQGVGWSRILTCRMLVRTRSFQMGGQQLAAVDAKIIQFFLWCSYCLCCWWRHSIKPVV